MYKQILNLLLSCGGIYTQYKERMKTFHGNCTEKTCGQTVCIVVVFIQARAQKYMQYEGKNGTQSFPP